MFFKLAQNVYAGHYEDDVIILDAANNKYLSITGALAKQLSIILNEEFTLLNGTYSLMHKNDQVFEEETLLALLNNFQERRFITETEIKVSNVLPRPKLKGGLSRYRWDTKSSLVALSKAPKWETFSSLLTLYKVHRLIKKKGIGFILDEIGDLRDPDVQYRVPSDEEISHLSDGIDAACTLYYKKVVCLGWAATFVIQALKKRWKCNFVIGAQSIPFYAHAWAEIDNKVINDSSQIQNYLTILLREPFGL